MEPAGSAWAHDADAREVAMRPHPRGGKHDRDRIGERIGKLTITGIFGRYQQGKVERIVYTAACDCGRTEQVQAHRLSGPKAITACTVCRTPTCRWCGASLGGPTMARTCSPGCRRALNAQIAAESRARGGADLATARAAWNTEYLRTHPQAREDKRASDRALYRRRLIESPDFQDRERERWHAYYDRKMDDPLYRERHRQRVQERRREMERVRMQQDIAALRPKDQGE